MIEGFLEAGIMAGEFWFDDAQWAVITPLLPANQCGAHRLDDHRILSGIVHVLKTGCRWQDTPAVYGPSTTIYNRYRRWSIKGVWLDMLTALVTFDAGTFQAIDSTPVKAHRSAAGGKRMGRPVGKWFFDLALQSAKTYPAFQQGC
jgi:transposase